MKVGKVGSRLMRHRSAFTLIEISVSILVLAVGLTAILSMIYMGLDWGKDIRNKTLAIETLRTVMEDAAIIDDTKDNDDAEVRGYVNGFYVIRRVSAGLDQHGNLINPSFDGDFRDVRVELYAGVLPGKDESTGTLLWNLKAALHEP